MRLEALRPRSRRATPTCRRRAARWAERNLDGAATRAARRGRALFPAPVGLDAVPQCHRQGGGHLDRGHRRPALHGFPRQQRASHRLRPSAAEARDRRADGRAAVHAAALHVGAGGRARAQARRDRAGRALARCCSRPAARMRSRSRSRSRAPRPAATRRCRSGTPSTAPASARRRSAARRCSARARTGR